MEIFFVSSLEISNMPHLGNRNKKKLLTHSCIFPLESEFTLVTHLSLIEGSRSEVTVRKGHVAFILISWDKEVMISHGIEEAREEV